MHILSIQSHVSYGYVGNKAAVFPLQALGFDVWPIHTVHFSNHTGYGKWQGVISSPKDIQTLIQGLEDLDLIKECDTILSGYIGSREIGEIITETVWRFKKINSKLIYLCDPVMGSIEKNCFVKADIPDFFKKNCLNVSDIITPNHFEAEILSGIKINTLQQLQQACAFFHMEEISIGTVTSLQLKERNNTKNYAAFLSIKNGGQWLATTPQLMVPIKWYR